MSNKIIDTSQPVSIDFTQTKSLVCKCGNYTFQETYFLRVLPSLLSPNGKDVVIPLRSFACNACGAVPDQVIPPILREETLKNTNEQQPKPNLTIV